MAEQYLYAVVLGLILGALLDLFRFFRLLVNDKFFFDFFYWIISAVCVFCYLILFNNGAIRILYILLIFSAAAFYALTFARLTKAPELAVAGFVKNTFKKIINSAKKVLKSMRHLYYNIKKARNVKTTHKKGDGNESGKNKKT